MNRIAIIIIGYNRVESIKRLVKSLELAQYKTSVDLIISIDKSNTDVVSDYAKTIEWNYGNKIIKTFRENLGLKKHVLTCGNYLNEYDYDAVIVLEDDIVVAPGFFNFALQAIDFYKDDNRIAGISLYKHTWNLNSNRPFEPLKGDSDVFFMQYAQSWGQIWFKKQWNDFFEWYKSEKYKTIDKNIIPSNVLEWDDKSWLKYHIQYCIDQNKYFVYPYYALTTNFSDAGTHNDNDDTKMQVPLSYSVFNEFKFEILSQTSIRYDAFFENQLLYDKLNLSSKDLTIDLYGMKRENKYNHYVLTSKKLNFKILKSYALQFKPMELNVMNSLDGNDIFLYDTSARNDVKMKKNDWKKTFSYDLRCGLVSRKKMLLYSIWRIFSKIK